MLKFETRGDPFERGLQHGKCCKQIALRWMGHSLTELTKQFKVSMASDIVRMFCSKLDCWRNQWESTDSSGIAECCGIAKGLGMDEEIYFLVQFKARLLKSFNGCTIAGFSNNRGQVIIGKTDDLKDFEVGCNVLQNAQPDAGHNYTGFGFAGFIGIFSGMNECGLAAAFTGIPGPCLDREGMPAYHSSHAVLSQCATVEEAVKFVESLKINYYGFSVLLGDADGNLTLMEKTGSGSVILPLQEGGFFLHTNHILDAEFAMRNPRQEETVDVNGRRRYENGLKLLSILPHSEGDMKEFLNDRSDFGAICQEGVDGLYSDYRAVFIPAQKKIIYWPGCSCDVKEEEY
ncbi:MAG: C45 family peptidase [Planctomycetota bacterium]